MVYLNSSSLAQLSMYHRLAQLNILMGDSVGGAQKTRMTIDTQRVNTVLRDIEMGTRLENIK